MADERQRETSGLRGLLTRLLEDERTRAATDGGAKAEPAASGDGPPAGETAENDPRTDAAATAREFADVVRRCSDGDLSARLPEADDPAMAELGEAVNELLDEWERTLVEVDVFAEQVNASTDHVSSTIGRARETSKEVSESVHEISEAAHTQSERVEQVAGEMRTLSAATEEVASSADEIARSTAEAAERGREGRSAATEAITELDAIESQTDETVAQVETLEGLVEEVDDVVEFITDIAQQTHILALNASIEASRAGEAGSGFAVVAEEVKELADETQDATQEIADAIDDIRTQADTTVGGIHETRDRVAEGIETVEGALDALEVIVDDVEETNASIQEVSDATDSQADSSQEVVTQADEVGAVSEETASQADTVASAARRQTTVLSEAKTNANTLAERADALDDYLDQFDFAATHDDDDGTTVRFWHAMSGEKAILLEELADEFAADRPGVSVETAAKGSYRGTFTSTLAAARSGNPPTIAQLFEVGTQRALDSGAFVPVEDVVRSADVEFDPRKFLDPVANYYRHEGTLWSMPFNSSNPILYYNRDAFARAGLDPDDPPETFDQLRDAAETLVDSGAAPYGTTWANYSWFVEQWFAAADEPLVDADNGRSGTPTTTALDGSVGEEIFGWWRDLEADGLHFDPGIEARGAAKEAFFEGEAAMLVGSTSSMLSVVDGGQRNGFEVGTGGFPAPGTRHGVVVGGGSLWVPADLPSEEQRAAAEFLAWLTEPEQQARWHRNTGYFPVHEDAVALLEQDGWFEEHPNFRTAFDQLAATRDSPATRGARIGPFDTVRTIVEEGFADLKDGRELGRVLDVMDEQVTGQLESYEAETR